MAEINQDTFYITDKKNTILTPEQIGDKKINLEGSTVSFNLDKVKTLVANLQKVYGTEKDYGDILAKAVIRINQMFTSNGNRSVINAEIAKLNSGNDLLTQNNRNAMLNGIGLPGLKSIVEINSIKTNASIKNPGENIAGLAEKGETLADLKTNLIDLVKSFSDDYNVKLIINLQNGLYSLPKNTTNVSGMLEKVDRIQTMQRQIATITNPGNIASR